MSTHMKYEQVSTLHMGRKAIRHVMLKKVVYDTLKTYRGGCMINYLAVPTQFEKLTCGK